MVILFLVLTGFSLVALVAGVVLMLASRGETRVRRGPQVGAEMMAGEADEETIHGVSAFKGKGIAVEREVRFSFSEIKAQVRAGRWKEVLPALLAMAGLLGLLLFGALALLAGLDNKLVGGLALLVVLYVVARQAIEFARA